MIVYFTLKKYDLNVIPTGAIPAGRESEVSGGQTGRNLLNL